ncbi:COP23 domain-containing protein [Coleofasciculus chthonoplastes]
MQTIILNFVRFSTSTQPTTIFRTSRGNIPVIRWVDQSFPPPWTPARRCE